LAVAEADGASWEDATAGAVAGWRGNALGKLAGAAPTTMRHAASTLAALASAVGAVARRAIAAALGPPEGLTSPDAGTHPLLLPALQALVLLSPVAAPTAAPAFAVEAAAEPTAPAAVTQALALATAAATADARLLMGACVLDAPSGSDGSQSLRHRLRATASPFGQRYLRDILHGGSEALVAAASGSANPFASATTTSLARRRPARCRRDYLASAAAFCPRRAASRGCGVSVGPAGVPAARMPRHRRERRPRRRVPPAARRHD